MKKMKNTFSIPPIMRELKIDERGYPIPFFVPIINGKPEFRFQDVHKQRRCLDEKLCSICGKKLYDKSYWFISGPLGLQNQTASDPPMHEDCARFSITVCPHLIYQNAERRTTPLKEGNAFRNPSQVLDKPSEIYLVKADKYNAVRFAGQRIIKFRPKYKERYAYEDGRLIRQET